MDERTDGHLDRHTDARSVGRSDAHKPNDGRAGGQSVRRLVVGSLASGGGCGKSQFPFDFGPSVGRFGPRGWIGRFYDIVLSLSKQNVNRTQTVGE